MQTDRVALKEFCKWYRTTKNTDHQFGIMSVLDNVKDGTWNLAKLERDIGWCLSRYNNRHLIVANDTGRMANNYIKSVGK